MHEVFNKLAASLFVEGKYEQAELQAQRAVEAHPGFADAWSNLGLIRHRLGKLFAAWHDCLKALSIDPQNVHALTNMGYWLQELGKWDEALYYYDRAMEANPGNCSMARYNAAVTHLFRKDFVTGWALYGDRFNSECARDPRRDLGLHSHVPGDEWDFTAILCEQGLGDQILFSSIFSVGSEQFGGFMEVDDRLVPAYKRAFPRATIVPRSAPNEAFRACSRQIYLGDMGGLFRGNEAYFEDQEPFLLKDPARTTNLPALRGDRPDRKIVGLSWCSFQHKGRKHLQDRKSMPAQELLPILSREDFACVSLQYGINVPEQMHGMLHDPQFDKVRDMEAMLAHLHDCDIVITTSNVTAHLAGAMGKPTWLLSPAPPVYHYWVPDEDGACLWYPSVRIVLGKDWKDCVARVMEMI